MTFLVSTSTNVCFFDQADLEVPERGKHRSYESGECFVVAGREALGFRADVVDAGWRAEGQRCGEPFVESFEEALSGAEELRAGD